MDTTSLERRRRPSARLVTRWATAILLCVSGLVTALTGIYFLFLPNGGYQGGRNAAYATTLLFSRGTWRDLHTWTGVTMLALAVPASSASSQVVGPNGAALRGGSHRTSETLPDEGLA